MFYFFCSGEAQGSPRRQGGGGGQFLIEKGGLLPGEGAGGQGAGRVSEGNLGGARLNIFFRGRNSHQAQIGFGKSLRGLLEKGLSEKSVF